ncbi:MAG: hypothetical protein OXD31_01760 [Chloroflexi bacterium]|nr:hypothetical protein [Chloroflexota bacterium]
MSIQTRRQYDGDGGGVGLDLSRVVDVPDWARRRSAWMDERRSSEWVTGMVVRLKRAWFRRHG